MNVCFPKQIHTQPIQNKDYLAIRQSTRNSNKRKERNNIVKHFEVRY